MGFITTYQNLIYSTPHRKGIYCYSPSVTRSLSGNIICSFDLGGSAIEHFHGVKGGGSKSTKFGQGKIFLSEDGGASWNLITNFPFWHARLFNLEQDIYLLGHDGRLAIMKSTDGGYTWSDTIYLTDNQKWHAAPCNTIINNGAVYVAMERRADLNIEGWNVAGLTPILLKANISDDLLKPESWKFSSEFTFNKKVIADNINYIGIPFYNTPERTPLILPHNRQCAPIGWLEANIVQITDPDHIWHDPLQKTFHLLMRMNTGNTNYGAVLKVVEQPSGDLITEFVRSPSGKKLVLLHIPGGHLKFHILYDEKSKIFWMCHSQSFDSMTKIETIAKQNKRYNLPNNERHRLELSFSKNCIDWCSAGMIAIGYDESQSYNYPSMIINQNDLEIVTRCGSGKVKDNQYTNAISFHRVNNFRNLIY